MAAGKKYVVRVPFMRRDPRTGIETNYTPGDPYTGDDIEKYLAGVDSQGPLLTEEPATAPSSSPVSATSKEN